MNSQSFHKGRLHDAAKHWSSPIPVSAGIGLKPQHCPELLSELNSISWVEVHAENYFCAGGAPHRDLSAVRQDYPVSFHGVGLSLGSSGRPDPLHLARLKELVVRYQPGLVSEHLSWSAYEGIYLNDLLPLPYSEECLGVFVQHVLEVQDHLGRRILVENPSTYLRLADSTISEPEFLAALTRQTGCGILLDINNVYVSACNHGFDSAAYINLIPPESVAEIHLAGHSVVHRPERDILIDDHGSRVSGAVWRLFDYGLQHCGARPTLVEWDNQVPPLSTLIAEAEYADGLIAAHERGAKHASTG